MLVALAREEEDVFLPTFSVIIPAYNQAEFLGDAIRSVLQQTCSDWELIVVDDASTDRTSEVVAEFADPRLTYLRHDVNRGLPAARNSGIHASTGGFIALLDADDFYHSEKLDAHRRLLVERPDVGVSYNGRYEMNHSSNTIRELWIPPRAVGLPDLVRGFPFAPSDMVIRREWAFRVGLFDESYVAFSEDLDINCRLALSGCAFVGIDRALNYRRYHAGRKIGNLRARLDAALRAVESALSDSRCPVEVTQRRAKALSEHYLVWAYYALAQGDAVDGEDFVGHAISLDPSILGGRPSRLVDFMTVNCVADDSAVPELMLRRVLSPLAPLLIDARVWLDWALARAYLLKAVRAVLWDRLDDGNSWFDRAHSLGAELDQPFLSYLAHLLQDYQHEFGDDSARDAFRRISPFLERIGGHQRVRWVMARCSVNRAHEDYRCGRYERVLAKVAQAVASNPSYLLNRGVWSISVRSALRTHAYQRVAVRQYPA